VTAIEAILVEVEKMRTDEVSDDELKQAIDGFMNSSVFDYDTKGEILSRALRYEYHEYPQDFVEQLMAGIREVTKADVRRVAAQYLHPDKFTLIAVGKASDFDKPLNTLGDVTEVDITIPPPSPEPAPEAGEEDVAKAKIILADVVEAYGGLEKLQSVRSLVVQGQYTRNTPGGMMQVEIKRYHMLPYKIRLDITVQAMGMQMSQVFDGESAWRAMPQGVQPLPGSEVEEFKKDALRDTINLLANLSGADISAQYLGAEDVNGKSTDVVRITVSDADLLKLFVDQETKYIIKKSYQSLGQAGPVETEEFIDDYRDVSGVKIGFHTVVHQNGEPFLEGTLNEAMINAEVDESLFEK
jgi:hypothetical protein